jgi:membrane protease YdiL (CAAX protease family)
MTSTLFQVHDRVVDDRIRAGSSGRGRREALACYGLALALALLVAVFGPRSADAVQLLTMLTPAVAVVAMIALATRSGHRRTAWIDLGLTRAGWRGWPWAVGLPVVVVGASYAGGSAILDVRWHVAGDALPNLVLVTVIVSVLAIVEEVCWRGYLLTRLSTPDGVRGALLVGLLHGVWHLPLILLTTAYNPVGSRWVVVPLFLAVLSGAGVVYGWLRTRFASLWPVVLAHGTFNALLGTADESTTPSSETTFAYLSSETGLLTVVATAAVAVVLVTWSGWSRVAPQ